MRGRILLAVALVGTVVATVVAAAPASARPHASTLLHKMLKLTFPVPAATTGAVTVLSGNSVTFTAPKGKKLGRFALHMAKPVGLDSNVRAVAVLQQPRKFSRRETVKVFASITHFPAA